MKREIKFRAWDSQKKEMLYPDEESYFTFGQSGNYFTFVRNGEIKVTKHEASLMQYTGLKDRNGKEIYEGDIVQLYDLQGVEWIKGTVGYRNDLARFMVEANLWNEFTDIVEVIGNLYENPELLKEEK